jgi:acetyl esterase
MREFPLHPIMSRLLAGAADFPPIHTQTPGQARAVHDPLFATLLPRPAAVARVEDRVAPGPAGPVPLRIYVPQGRGPFPVALYLHGGGFVLGSLDSYDSLCRGLCNGAGCLVVAAGYRLAPEHRFPAGLEDACAAWAWTAAHAERLGGDPARLALAGDSAGATLAAGVALRVSDRGGPAPGRMLLVYPALDLSNFASASYRRFADSLLLTRRLMGWFRAAYFARASDRRDPYASPLLAPSLAGLPATLQLDAEFDVLTSEQEAFAGRLAAAGVPARRTVFPGTLHPFFGLAGMSAAENGMAEACAFLNWAAA